MASFIDEFDRADGGEGLGPGWDLRGAMSDRSYGPPPASDGFIRDGTFTYAGENTVYAARVFGAPVRMIGAVGEFTRIGDGSESAILMMFTPNDRLVVNVVHFAASRYTWNLAVRGLDGRFRYEAKREIIPPLELDRPYIFEIAARERFVDVRVAEKAESVEAPAAAGLIGNRAVWGQFRSGDARAAEVFRFDAVWAQVDGERTMPVPLPEGLSR